MKKSNKTYRSMFSKDDEARVQRLLRERKNEIDRIKRMNSKTPLRERLDYHTSKMMMRVRSIDHEISTIYNFYKAEVAANEVKDRLHALYENAKEFGGKLDLNHAVKIVKLKEITIPRVSTMMGDRQAVVERKKPSDHKIVSYRSQLQRQLTKMANELLELVE